MKNIPVFLIVLFCLFCFCSRASALIVLDPDEDIEIVEKKVVNEDGTILIVEEPVIKREIIPPEVVETLPEPKEKVKHSRGWEKTLGNYTPKDPGFTVVRKRPENWPIPENLGKAKPVPADVAAKTKEKDSGLGWIVKVFCFGVIGFGALKLFFHWQDTPDPNKT